jgi:PAS domain S-box-containing protein
MAWIGWVDPASSMVIPTASDGKGADEYLHDIKVSIDIVSEYSQGPTGTAIRENRPFWCEDFLNASFIAPWRERAAVQGWRSSAALPLHRDGVAVGAFTMYADEPYVFEEDVRELLIEMAQDIDYALDNFSHEAKRKQAEDELRKLSLAVEQSPSSIVITDLDARLEYVNDAFVKSTGYSREEALGQNPRLLHSGKTPRTVHDDMWAHLTRGETWRGEMINKRKDGSEYIESVLVAPVHDAEGRTSHYLGIKEDITERKRVEQQVIAQLEHVTLVNAQLVEANKQLEFAKSQLLQSEKMAAIGLLAAGVAHEINNPVGYVNSNLGTLEKYLADIFVVIDKYEAAEALDNKGNPLLDELRQFKARIDFNFLREDIKSLIAESHQGLERIKKIILDLKDFSRSEVNEQWSWADVHHGLDTTLNVVWNELKYKCEVVKEYGELPDIYCLPSQLNQVFMNLLVNAAHAIEVRGTITIRTGSEGERVWVEVGDTGRGIPPQNIPRLFDPFFTTKPVGMGTGLGLSVSYKIVEKHHGKIEVQSAVGKGTTFRVWLPVRPPEGKNGSIRA